MKKIFTFMTAVAMATSAFVPSVAVAESDSMENLPIMYLTVTDNEKISVLPNGAVYINSSELTEDTDMRVNVYIKDDSKTCWDVSPKVKCESSYVTLSEAVDPSDVGENSAYQSPYDFGQTFDQECNTVNIRLSTPMMASADTTLTPTGEATDDYPVAYFNATVDSDIPSGKYRIYFLTEPTDYEGQRVTTVSSILADTFTPELQEQKVLVSDRKLGDVNNDGFIDTIDATAILTEYAMLATDGGTFDESMKVAGDINADSFTDSIDASNILLFYAYLATDHETNDFVEYLYTIQSEI